MSDAQDTNTELNKKAEPTPVKKKAPSVKAAKPKAPKAAAPKATTPKPKLAKATKAKSAAPKATTAKPVAPKAAPKAAAKAASPKKAATKRGRGKRYTSEQKAEILSFVDAFNAKKGRGGATAASKKFKVSQLTIGNWQRETSLPTSKSNKGSSDISAVLKRLDAVHKKMAKQEDILSVLRKEYAQLKSQL